MKNFTWWISTISLSFLFTAVGYAEDEALAARIQALRQTQLAPDTTLLWSSEIFRPKVEAGNHKDWPSFTDDITFKVEKSLEERLKPQEVVVSPKGEFEKTSDYEARVADAKRKYLAELEDRKMSVSERRNIQIREGIMTRLGKPTIKSIAYDPDNENFKVELSGTNPGLLVSGKIHMPVAEAAVMKTTLQAAAPWIAFSVKDERFSIGTAFLQDSTGKVYTLTDVSPPINKLIGEKRYAAYQQEQAIAQVKAQEETRKQQALDAKREAEARKVDEKRQKEIAKTHPYVGILTCRVNGMEVVLPACLDKYSEIRVFTVKGQESWTMSDIVASGGMSRFQLDLPLHFNLAASAKGGYTQLNLVVQDRVTGRVAYTGSGGSSGVLMVRM